MSKKLKILLVDDEPDVLEYLQTRLEKLGYAIIPAESGPEALETFYNAPESFDMLLTDVVMPQMSGFDLAKRLHQAAPSMKVLFMSGYTGTEYFRQKGMLGKDLPFIEKPFHIEDLAEKIEATLGTKGTPSAFETIEEIFNESSTPK
jgi:two-component system cell cycle sensor histidine kinase/response regulator CckA